MTTVPDPDGAIADADEAYLSFGGWAKPLGDPPGLHERRRYIVDVECTAAGIGTSEKGERHTRKLSILRVKEVTGVSVPPRDADEAQGELFPADDEWTDGTDDPAVDAAIAAEDADWHERAAAAKG